MLRIPIQYICFTWLIAVTLFYGYCTWTWPSDWPPAIDHIIFFKWYRTRNGSREPWLHIRRARCLAPITNMKSQILHLKNLKMKNANDILVTADPWNGIFYQMKSKRILINEHSMDSHGECGVSEFRNFRWQFFFAKYDMFFGRSSAIRLQNRNSMEMWTSNGEREFLEYDIPCADNFTIWRQTVMNHTLVRTAHTINYRIVAESVNWPHHDIPAQSMNVWSHRLICRSLLIAQSIHRQCH